MSIVKNLALFLVLLAAAFAMHARADEAADVVVDDAGADDVAEVAEEAAEAVVIDDGMTDEEREQLSANKESFQFQAEVNRLMDIIINSLYSNRDIFLRELISNSSDALEKIRFQSLSDGKDVLGEGDQANLDIHVEYNPEAKTLTLRDRGVGMTKQNLIDQLGVVASSGTTQFVEAAAKGTDALALIGQFGVGFYSVYLVADRVTVTSKNNADEQHIWESTANSDFTIAKDPRGNTLGRGTEIKLHLKEDAEEFLSEQKLEEIIARYSEFIQFPIYLKKTKTVSEEVPDEEAQAEADAAAAAAAEAKAAAGDDEDSDLEVSDDEDEKEPEPPKMKTINKEVVEWEQVNVVKAVWTRNPSEVEEEEYQGFYKDLSKDSNGALSHVHFKAEGEISFKSILYIPEKAADGHYDRYYEKSNALKLYVRKVLISDEFEDFMPRYLNFIRGVVDSEDLPLNVSRETLAQSRVLKVMGKKLTRKALEMLRKLAEESEASMDDAEDEEEKTGEDAEGEDGDKKEEKKVEDKYATFWKQFGRSIKLGMVDDASNRSKLAKLLRFETNKSEDKIISLQDYVDDMAEGQKYIYYITGASVAEVKNSPFLEKLEARGFEVIYMVDTLDEYVVQNLSEFDGKKLMSATKDGLKFGDEGVRTKNKLKAQQEEFEPLTTWMKDLYGKKVEKVVITNRLSKTPCIIVTGQYGWSANMERIMKAQTMTDGSAQTWMHAKKTLELNPNHPIIRELKNKVEADSESQEAKDQANLLRDAAELQSGFQMEDSEAFAARIHRVLAGRLDVDLNEDFVDESNAEDDAQYDDPEPEPEPEAAEEEDAVDLDAAADDAEEPAAEESAAEDSAVEEADAEEAKDDL